MKNFKTSVLIALAFALATPLALFAQEEESSASIDGGFDLYTSYIWRGAKFGSGPAFQPWVEGSIGSLAIGAWGSVNAGPEEALEMDLYVGYSFDFGLSVAVTDYYFGGDWTEFDVNHYIEPMISYEIGDLSITGAYMLVPGSDAVDAIPAITGSPAMVDLTTGAITPELESVEAAEATGKTAYGDEADIYVELGYSIGDVSLAVGAGNGAYVSEEDDFTVCNITVGTSKDIEITESFTLPLSAAVTLNPSTGGFFITAGVSF